MKKIFTLFAAAMMAVSMMAATASFDFSKQGYENGQAIESVTISDDVTATFAKGTNNNAPKYYNTSGNAIRLYGGNSMTVVSTSNNLTNIKLTFDSGEGTNEITTDCGTFATDTWTGEAASVTFTVGGDKGHRRIQVIEVTTDGEDGPVVEKCPKAIFSVAEGAILDNTEVDAININFELPAGIEATADLFIEGVVTNGADVNDPIMAFTDFEDGVDAGIDYMAEGEYTINITHVAYGKQIGMDEETYMPIYEHDFVAEEGKALASLHFTIKAAVECPEEGYLFTVAEAKDAYTDGCIKDNDSIAIMGYISNMFLKPNNFTKYGSVNIWITDTKGGSEKEFELYNCYGFMGDTLTTYEVAEGFEVGDGKNYVDVTSVTGRNGMVYHIGDYVEAAGMIKLFNSTYELNTGCYLTTKGEQIETAIENTKDVKSAQKVIRNGQVFIIREGAEYSVMGARK